MGRKIEALSGRGWILYLLAGCGLFLWFQRSGIPTVVELRDAWSQERAREQRIQAIREENDHIEESIKELAPEGREVEKLARQELGLARPGQTVIKIPDKQ
jgi:cell division protein FtsB